MLFTSTRNIENSIHISYCMTYSPFPFFFSLSVSLHSIVHHFSYKFQLLSSNKNTLLKIEIKKWQIAVVKKMESAALWDSCWLFHSLYALRFPLSLPQPSGLSGHC